MLDQAPARWSINGATHRSARSAGRQADYALEQAARDRTIYAGWHVFLLHNEIFAEVRHHPRFEALLERVADKMRRQRAELSGAP